MTSQPLQSGKRSTTTRVVMVIGVLALLGPVMFAVLGFLAGISPACAAVVDFIDRPATHDDLRHRLGSLVGWSPSRSGEFWLAAAIMEVEYVLIGGVLLALTLGARGLLRWRRRNDPEIKM